MKSVKDIKEKTGGFWKDFKAFISRGNVVDMAVGVIIGGAFGKIVTSLVNDIIMPAIGLLFCKMDFTKMKYVITPEVKDAAGTVTTPESAILYGNFIQQVVDFLIVAFCIFVMVKLINGLRKKAIAAEAAAAAEKAAADAAAAEAAAKVVAERDQTQADILATLKSIEANLKK